MIDLLNPNREELLKKWQDVIAETNHIWTWTTVAELSWLAEYATRCSSILEIGSYNGRSAKVMLLANPDLRLVSIDTWDDENLPAYLHNLGPEIAGFRVKYIQGKSQEGLVKLNNEHHSEILADTKRRFDGCFIDGGHLEHLVIADIKGVMPLMKAGSLLAGHDFRGDNDVARGIRAVLGENFANPVDSVWTHQL